MTGARHHSQAEALRASTWWAMTPSPLLWDPCLRWPPTRSPWAVSSLRPSSHLFLPMTYPPDPLSVQHLFTFPHRDVLERSSTEKDQRCDV